MIIYKNINTHIHDHIRHTSCMLKAGEKIHTYIHTYIIYIYIYILVLQDTNILHMYLNIKIKHIYGLGIGGWVKRENHEDSMQTHTYMYAYWYADIHVNFAPCKHAERSSYRRTRCEPEPKHITPQSPLLSISLFSTTAFPFWIQSPASVGVCVRTYVFIYLRVHYFNV